MLLSFSFFRIQCFSFPGWPLGTKDGRLPDPLRLLPSESPFLPAPSTLAHLPAARKEAASPAQACAGTIVAVAGTVGCKGHWLKT